MFLVVAAMLVAYHAARRYSATLHAYLWDRRLLALASACLAYYYTTVTTAILGLFTCVKLDPSGEAPAGVPYWAFAVAKGSFWYNDMDQVGGRAQRLLCGWSGVVW
jgi:hypothetical protein